MVTKPHDAITMLIADHKNVRALFAQYEKLSDRSKVNKKKLADQICHELLMHAQIEEQIFYPAVRKPIHDDALMDEALVEHANAKELIEQIMAMDPDDELYDAKVKVLSEQIEHHVGEEEDDMFLQVRKTKLDLNALGAEMAELKERSSAEPALSMLFHSGV
ncbi:MAG: hemerythrin domain-containing protein [Burkholderiales bacterium]|nr:hemerythrin domain-containing protein [Burkholderiales bacterium]